jgi:[protein-PII] uridylyltransferase
MNAVAAGHDIERLRAQIVAFGETQAAAFQAGEPVERLVRQRADAFDGWLRQLWVSIIGERSDLALFAVGGYGRGELHPQSDIDVLLLVDEEPDLVTREHVETFISALWDLNLRPGHAVRTAAGCTQAAADVTVCTALIEARLLAGPDQARQRLADAVSPDRVWPVEDFVRAKLDEVATRHARYGDTSYNLEPNLKEGPGGLRDLQTVVWVALRATGSADPARWCEAGIVGDREWTRLVQARDTLLRLRFGLHLIAGRAEERLLFDHQPALAALFGFTDERRDNRAVEQLMQEFFRAAQVVRRGIKRIAARWRERDPENRERAAIDGEFERCGDRLAVLDADLFVRDPAAIVRLFRRWQQHAELVDLDSGTASALDDGLIAAGDRMASLPAARDGFIDILRHSGVAQTLRRMQLYGVLGAYLPAFAHVTGRMQYDLFHVYTVDQHTLNVIGNIDRMAAGETPEFPQANDVYESLRKPELLYIAALFHDIAKGRGGDHSELGAEDAATFCRSHGYGEADVDLVAWLVRQHLLLSVTAQKSDITDPAVINRFAGVVEDRDRLDALYLLTMADIAGTAPTLWNTWKARLVADLHAASRFALRRGLEHPIHAEERMAECRKTALAQLDEAGIAPERVEMIWKDFPPSTFLRYRPSLIAWVTQNVADTRVDALPLVAARREGERGAREIFVHSPDIDGLFAAITSALDRLDLDVVEARVLTSTKGLSLDTFRVLERGRRETGSGSEQIYAEAHVEAERQRDQEIVRSLRYALNQRPLRLGPVKRSLTRAQRHFHISAQIEFAPAHTPNRTRMSLVCSDRPGLLAQLAQVLREERVRVHGARIATFGERVEDFFLLSDERDQPLDETTSTRLGMALRERLDTP